MVKCSECGNFLEWVTIPAPGYGCMASCCLFGEVDDFEAEECDHFGYSDEDE